MATRREPRFKLCRRLGVNVCGHPKAMDRYVGEGARRKKPSEYSRQLTEKQKIKAFYGILERQFRRYMEKSEKSKEVTGTALLKQLECRLDNLVYRLGFGRSIRQARQFVNHGHILVNGRQVDVPSYSVRPGDMVSVREQSRSIDKIQDNIQSFAGQGPAYLDRDFGNFSGKLLYIPPRDEIPIEVNEILAVELYSK